VFGTEQYASPIDAFGNAIQNAAGFAFSSDPPATESIITLIGQRVEPFYDLQKAIEFTNSVNSAALTFDNNWTLAKGQLCCRQVSLLTTVTGDEPYVIVEYALELRSGFVQDSDGYWDGFKLRIENMGTEGLYDGAGGVLLPGPLVRLVWNESLKMDVLEKVSFQMRLDNLGKPMQGGIYVGVPYAINAKGYVPAVANSTHNPNAIYELSPTGDAWYLKVWPRHIKLKNLADLGL